MADDTPQERNIALEDQRQAAAAQSRQLAETMATLSGLGLEISEASEPHASTISRRVFDDWVESINGGAPRGLCMHLREHYTPQPLGGFPFMPGGLFCLKCIINVMAKLSEPDFPGAVPCPGCNQEAPLAWGSITTGMHTLYYGLCRVCRAEDDFAEDG